MYVYLYVYVRGEEEIEDNDVFSTPMRTLSLMKQLQGRMKYGRMP